MLINSFRPQLNNSSGDVLTESRFREIFVITKSREKKRISNYLPGECFDQEYDSRDQSDTDQADQRQFNDF
jgi:hypothetical protein